MAVLRMGYAHAKVTDLEEAKKHYGYTMGLYETRSEPGRVFYKGWDEWDHHSVVLEEGGVGLAKIGYKVSHPEDIEIYEKRAEQFGCTVQRMTAGENPEVSDGIRITLPSTHELELYHDMTLVGTEVGNVNPEVFPRHLIGVGAPRVEHALLATDDVKLADRFFREVLDFYATERVQTSLDDDCQYIGTWLCAGGNQVHDIAFIDGPPGKLHHFAFQLKDWSEILRAGQLFAMDDVSVDIGPTQHGITRGETIYFFDPAGNRNELYTGGYWFDPDDEPTTWTESEFGRAIFYYQGKINPAFMTVHS
jgi:catechol 2,3-dioxygenase